MTPDPQVLDIAVGSILVFNGLAVFLLWGSVRSRSGIELPAFAVCWLLYGIRILGPSERLLDRLVQRSGTSTDEFADYTLRQLIGWTRKPRLALDDDLTLLVIDVPENGNSAVRTR